MGSRGQSAEGLLWSLLVIFPAPSFDDHTGVCQAGEPVFVQAFLPEAAIERFDVGVLVGLAKLDEEQLNTPSVAWAQLSMARPQNSLPLSVRIALSNPLVMAS